MAGRERIARSNVRESLQLNTYLEPLSTGAFFRAQLRNWFADRPLKIALLFLLGLPTTAIVNFLTFKKWQQLLKSLQDTKQQRFLSVQAKLDGAGISNIDLTKSQDYAYNPHDWIMQLDCAHIVQTGFAVYCFPFAIQSTYTLPRLQTPFKLEIAQLANPQNPAYVFVDCIGADLTAVSQQPDSTVLTARTPSISKPLELTVYCALQAIELSEN